MDAKHDLAVLVPGLILVEGDRYSQINGTRFPCGTKMSWKYLQCIYEIPPTHTLGLQPTLVRNDETEAPGPEITHTMTANWLLTLHIKVPSGLYIFAKFWHRH